MRNLFLSLVLLNLLLLGWQLWVVPPDSPDPYGLPGREQARAPALVLLERSPDPPQPPAAERAGPAPAVCARLGPFADDERAEQTARVLRERDMEVTLLSRAGEVWVGHWVQLIGFDDWSVATGALDGLAEVGLDDAYVVSVDGQYKVSLGVFRGRSGAGRVAELARRAGFEPVIEDRFRASTELWLAVRHAPGAGPKLGELSGDGEQILRLEAADCESPGDGGARADSLE